MKLKKNNLGTLNSFFIFNIPFGRKCAHFTILSAVLSIAFTGCFGTQDEDEINERIYATVNGVHLAESGLRAIIPKDFYDRLTPEHKRKIIEEWVNKELLFQEALSLEIEKDPEIENLLYNSKRNLLSNEFLERELSNIKIPTDAQLRVFYNNNKEYFEIQTKDYEVRYALFDNKKDATSFSIRVKKNESFSKLAKEYSKHPSSQNGGELGLVNEEIIEPNIWNNIISIVENRGIRRVSDPFRVIDGWGCVIVDRVHEPGTIKPFEYVRNLVLDMYLAEEREKAQTALIKRLTVEADIRYQFP